MALSQQTADDQLTTLILRKYGHFLLKYTDHESIYC